MPDTAESTVRATDSVISYPAATADAREGLLQFARTATFSYGTWNRFKQLYKAVESDSNADPVLFGALLGRIENSPISLGNKDPRVQFGTLTHIKGVLVQGQYAFAVGGSYYWGSQDLIVTKVNPSDPMKLTEVAIVPMPDVHGDVVSMTVCGTVLCIVIKGNNVGSALYLVDVSDPTKPKRGGSWSTNRSIHVYDHNDATLSVYLNGSGISKEKPHSLATIAVSATGQPKIVSESPIHKLSGEASAYAADQMLAAFIFPPVGFSWWSLPQKGGVCFVDLSTPANATVISRIEVDSPLSVARQGTFAYVGVGTHSSTQRGVQVIDVSDPYHPRLMGFCATEETLSNLYVSPDGSSVYAFSQNGTLYTIDVRIPAAPKKTHSQTGLHGAKNMVMVGDQAYIPTQWQGTALLSLRVPQTPVRIGTPPSADTMGYMKRRGRRDLRRLRKGNPARFVEITTEMLVNLAGKDVMIDPARHWATIDVLYGGGNRFRQTKHGRGRYIPTGASVPKLVLRTREERMPEVWDAHPDALNRLLTTADLPVAVYAFAARALRSSAKPLPKIPEGVIQQWLNGSEPLLTVLAIRSITARLQAGENLSAPLTAEVFFKAGAATRKALAREYGGAWAGKRAWAEAFATRLAELIKQSATLDKPLSGRLTDAGILLAQRFAWAITTRLESILWLVAPFAASGNPTLISLITSAANQIDRANVLPWLVELNRVADTEKREPVLAALEAGLRKTAFERSTTRWLIFHKEPFVRAAGWRMIAASTTDGDILREVWQELLSSTQPTPALTTAMASSHALGLLERAGIGATELADYVAARTFLVELLSPEAFRSVAATAPASVILSLIAAAPDNLWQQLRPTWLTQLERGVGTEAIWLAIENAVANDTTGRLEERLLGDLDIAATALLVPDEKLLDIRAPEFANVLGAWVRRYKDRLTKNSALLFTAATHPLPTIRDWALARVGELGMDMPFALRLMESLVPPSAAVGKAFFDAEPAGGDQEPDYALALADSPFIEVRSVGLEYIQSRWATLPQERILLALFENPAPEVQAFVTERLGNADLPRPAETPLFDAEVLRTTNRARIAKERIKTRQTTQPSMDTATLLILARGRTPRDAEWALGELARRAAQGEAIEGIAVEGIVGI